MEAKNASLEKSESQERNNLVAYWSVPLLDGVHTVEFEHGTKSGKRVLRVDGVEIFRRDWMFKLVGDEEFYLGKQEAKCLLKVDPIPNFAFSYSLLVDGKPLEKFTEKQSQAIRSWAVITEGKRYRIVFGIIEFLIQDVPNIKKNEEYKIFSAFYSLKANAEYIRQWRIGRSRMQFHL
ncbi:fas apoptotic inhibitory molecule 1 isoform X2 [Diorhabda sublineata]|uniref:fas apoptotic inhibitory molecule 1 isoform X2 n=1 Tax=Diorhabda sublineata TaxID=1163346 RepID=UPI0024E1399F|nr:fas apoptotic inhibitory molecule 1 isoform X2 [Diorhabda sublineata]XP_056645892.1 fas apoptotic inhibitory molecule 1 isoform X2 [Diorhabda sublineata]